jgi:hypothetical protein
MACGEGLATAEAEKRQQRRKSGCGALPSPRFHTLLPPSALLAFCVAVGNCWASAGGGGEGGTFLPFSCQFTHTTLAAINPKCFFRTPLPNSKFWQIKLTQIGMSKYKESFEAYLTLNPFLFNLVFPVPSSIFSLSCTFSFRQIFHIL